MIIDHTKDKSKIKTTKEFDTLKPHSIWWSWNRFHDSFNSFMHCCYFLHKTKPVSETILGHSFAAEPKVYTCYTYLLTLHISAFTSSFIYLKLYSRDWIQNLDISTFLANFRSSSAHHGNRKVHLIISLKPRCLYWFNPKLVSLKMIGKGLVLFEVNSSPSAFYIIKPTCIVTGF